METHTGTGCFTFLLITKDLIKIKILHNFNRLRKLGKACKILAEKVNTEFSVLQKKDQICQKRSFAWGINNYYIVMTKIGT